ncbi:MAB_1171c family putative transporter [Streptomyces buecherae]|uniref:MAB_1171c family putative transporter n=1 Tax=Streptomyces buecherae TaxID=2763006 RepID=UPI0036680AFF
MLDLKAIIFPICAAICLLALVYKLRDFMSHRKDAALIALLAAFTCKGISFTLSTPSVSSAVDAYTGINNLGALGIHLFGGVASSAAILIAIVYWAYPADEARRRARRRLLITLLCAAIMLTLWTIAGSGGGGRSRHYLLQNAHRPLVATYLLFYVGIFGAGMIEIMRLCTRYGRMAGRPWLRRGLYSTAIGAAAYLVYCLNRAAVLIAVQVGLEPLRWEILTPIANMLGISFLAAGLTMPSWGPKLSNLLHQVNNFVTYRRLHPLWLALYKANPNIALGPRPATAIGRFMPGDINYRLYRQIIEIQDGLLALRPYTNMAKFSETIKLPPGRGLTGEKVQASLQAAAIQEALRAKESNHPLEEDLGSIKPTQYGDYAAEVAWLLRVARAYSTLPTEKRSNR